MLPDINKCKLEQESVPPEDSLAIIRAIPHVPAEQRKYKRKRSDSEPEDVMAILRAIPHVPEEPRRYASVET